VHTKTHKTDRQTNNKWTACIACRWK